MKRNSVIAATLLLIGGASLAACGDDSDSGTEPSDGGGEGGTQQPSMDAGERDAMSDTDSAPPPFVPPTEQPDVSCGGTMCTPLTQAEVSAGFGNCCTGDEECGVTTALTGDTCLAPSEGGGADPSCPSLVMDMTMGAGGCCTPDGECGALIGGTGCVANSLLMQPESSCTYDPDNTCTRILEVTCDGNEDCPGDKVCCGQYAGGYRRTVCVDDCAAEEAEQGGTWAQFCHPGDTCIDPDGMGFMCLASTMFLPDDLARCRTTGTELARAGNTEAGMINCGLSEEEADGTIRRQVCGSGQKCCISYPGEVGVCVASDDNCPCATGGGTSGADAGTEADAG